MNFLRKFVNNRRAAVKVSAIIGLVIAIFVAAYTLPDAINAITNSTAYAATVPDSVVTMMTTVGGIVIAAVFIIMLYRSSKGD